MAYLAQQVQTCTMSSGNVNFDSGERTSIFELADGPGATALSGTPH